MSSASLPETSSARCARFPPVPRVYFSTNCGWSMAFAHTLSRSHAPSVCLHTHTDFQKRLSVKRSYGVCDWGRIFHGTGGRRGRVVDTSLGNLPRSSSSSRRPPWSLLLMGDGSTSTVRCRYRTLHVRCPAITVTVFRVTEFGQPPGQMRVETERQGVG